MKIRSILLTSAGVLFCAASISATTLAHTWVSGSGSDSNTCTFASPCATFTGALAKTVAGGMISAKDAGDFGAVTITQSVTIDGSNLGSIATNNVGVQINNTNSTPIDVVLLNLTISGTGQTMYGIEMSGAINLTVDNCRFINLSGDGGGLYAFSNATQNVTIRNSIFSGFWVGIATNSGVGIARVSLQNVTITGAVGSAVVGFTGIFEITGSVITQSGTGIDASNGSTISVASSMITANTTGVCSEASSKIRLDNNDIYDNTTAIGNCGGTIKTSTTNKTSGTIAIPASDVSNSVTF
jgi:hypothetical protein